MEFFFSLVHQVLCSLVVVGMVSYSVHLYRTTRGKSEQIRKKLKVQGIDGPVPSYLFGNVPEMQTLRLNVATKPKSHNDIAGHDYTNTLFPYLDHWRKQYGLLYTYSTGSQQHLFVNEPELVKALNLSNTLDLGKVPYITKSLGPMLGTGIIRSNGHHWEHQRKIVAPEFFMDKVKGMVGIIVESVEPMIREWEERVEGNNGKATDIRVDVDLRNASANVIARGCFGSSYSKGKHIFEKLRTIQLAITKHSYLFGITSFRDLVFGRMRKIEISKLEKEIDTLIWETVKERQQEFLNKPSQQKKDLMQLILEAAAAATDDELGNIDNIKVSNRKFVVDNCKNIYFAGHETTAIAASWCLMLLALHPEWQSRAREEVAKFCKNGIPDAESIYHLKTVTMVIQETLRLYPPAAFVSRAALADTRIGNLVIPKDTCIWTLVPSLHRDIDIWGEDANEFKPQRFANGVFKACKHPQTFVPFGFGSRLCLGKNFAMVELKIILSMIISKFDFCLSDKYQHSPTFRMLVEPEHGVLISIKKV